MARILFFGFRINEEESKMIESLARRLRRSKSDAVRFVVVNAALKLGVRNLSDKYTNVSKEFNLRNESDNK